ncbi:MAG: hypothetical protein LBF89_02900 [Bacteroidales bacterium]|jgi:hypothetical protein|nr:hypothetical protein [Bacteroidales bacterium]
MNPNSCRKSRASAIAFFTIVAAGYRKEKPPAPLPVNRTVIAYPVADNIPTRQGETPEISPRGSALPP